jgi:transposase
MLWGGMDAPPLVSPEVLASLPAEVLALIEWQARQIQLLTARVAALEAELAQLKQGGKNPTNSSLPPSTTHPHAKPPSPRPKSKHARGGQPGHVKQERQLIPADQCQDVVVCLPTACRRCGKPLRSRDPKPLRHQVWELPDIQPIVIEYQRHRLLCSCGCSTCGELPPGVPTGQAGPRLIAFAGLLMACFRQSKRRAALFLSTILNQPASASWMVLLQNRAAEAVEPAYHELAEQLPTQAALNIDESPTKEGQAKAWVWTFVAATFTFFACRLTRAGEVAKDLLGSGFEGVIHCDRAKIYWRFGKLQWCWAHLKRDFQALIDSPCHTKKRLGHDLMRQTRKLFALWHKVRDGTISRSTFQRQMQPIRQTVDALLLRGYFNGLTYSFCKELWEHRQHLWTFVDVEGIEPTNNAAEQALRHAVIWRKLSFGTQSASGSRFVERMLTVIETCRRQERNVFAWLVEAVRCHIQGEAGPSLLAGQSANLQTL